jgi:CBS domain containing-hemolysin-like protein
MHAGEGVLFRSLRLLWVLRIGLAPVAKGLMAVEFIVRRLLGRGEATAAEESERMEQEILDAVSEGELHGAVDEEQKEIIESVFELHDTTVNEIMTPRTDIIAISADASLEQAGQTIEQAGHSRIPVYEESLDRIVGVLYAKDLIGLNNGEPFDVRRLMRTVPYVPETKNVDHLLRELRQGKVHIAIVLDEYGGTAGLVTIEDILEELVGEIDDEYDRRPPPAIHRLDADTVEVDARVHVDDVNDTLGVALPDDGDYETIGGFVFTTLGKIPEQGEELKYENVRIRVIDAEPRRINRLHIRVEREAEAE